MVVAAEKKKFILNVLLFCWTTKKYERISEKKEKAFYLRKIQFSWKKKIIERQFQHKVTRTKKTVNSLAFSFAFKIQ